jgi:prepilin-type N-terminal cleavage/methylation domain-containing protein
MASPAEKALTLMLWKSTIANNSNSKRRGFTLIEMGVVVLIIAMFAALVMPAMARWRAGDEYRAFPGKLLRFVGKAKQEAIERKQSRSIAYDTTTGEFKMVWTDPGSSAEQEGGRLSVPAEMEMGRVIYLGNDTSIENWKLTFFQDGSAEDAGFEVRDQDRYLTVIIDSLGHIKMTRDPLPEQTDVRWSAGENEIRAQ